MQPWKRNNPKGKPSGQPEMVSDSPVQTIKDGEQSNPSGIYNRLGVTREAYQQNGGDNQRVLHKQNACTIPKGYASPLTVN